MKIVKMRETPEMAEKAESWFHSKWGVPVEAYRESISDCLRNENPVPQWYLAMEEERIVGGIGVIENDFHDRKDLRPNVCAVYVGRRAVAAEGLRENCYPLSVKI